MDPLDSLHRLGALDGRPLVGTSVWDTSRLPGPSPGRRGCHGMDNASRQDLNFWKIYHSVS